MGFEKLKAALSRLTAYYLWLLQNYKDEAQKQRKIIYQLEKERDRYINEASDLTQKVLQHMEDVKVREMQIFDYKKKIAEADTKLKQQQVSKSKTWRQNICQGIFGGISTSRELIKRNVAAGKGGDLI